jgi:hypothetical protein
VLVTGAGGGREVLGLVDRGFDAIGYEPQPRLVREGSAILAAHGAEGRLRAGPRDRFPRHDAPLDAVLVGWGSYMLMPGRARRLEFLCAARERLEPGAPMLLSFFVRSSGERDFHRLAAAANLVRRLRGDEPVDVGDALRPNFVHFFTIAEIRDELREGGFSLDLFGAEPYGHALARAA